MANATHGKALLHVRYAGRSLDLPLSDLDLGRFSAENEVKTALAAYLGEPVSVFRHYVVDRHANGNQTLRPEAVFG